MFPKHETVLLHHDLSRLCWFWFKFYNINLSPLLGPHDRCILVAQILLNHATEHVVMFEDLFHGSWKKETGFHYASQPTPVTPSTYAGRTLHWQMQQHAPPPSWVLMMIGAFQLIDLLTSVPGLHARVTCSGEDQEDLEWMCGGWYEGAWHTCWMAGGVQGSVEGLHMGKRLTLAWHGINGRLPK